MSILISIFTPTYNRAHLLKRLYNSLLNQKLQNFEWIIVDDGSVDNTHEVVNAFISENKVSVTYYKKENGGKHRAINKGVELAKGELFFIVDSDDYLTESATSLITNYYSLIKNREDIAGVSFRRGESKTKYIGTQKTFDAFEATALEFRYKYKIYGDMAEVFKTKVLKQYPFPEIVGEKFCTEGLIWSRIALTYKLFWTSEIIYIGEYLEGGLTDNSYRLRKSAPEYAALFYSEHTKLPISLTQKIRAAINYWRFAKFIDEPFFKKWRKVNPILSVIAYPVSLIFIIKDSK